MRPTFSSIIGQHPDILFNMLNQCYDPLLKIDNQHWGAEVGKWKQFDANAFEHPDSIGSCMFLTLVDDQVVGFGSYYPRHKPEQGIVGHNCILPDFRRKGLGLWQLREILRRLAAEGIKKASATTHEHAFFEPARRMYVACGFRKVDQHPWETHPDQNVIEYERDLDNIAFKATP